VGDRDLASPKFGWGGPGSRGARAHIVQQI
jgi:hypothetical protein